MLWPMHCLSWRVSGHVISIGRGGFTLYYARGAFGSNFTGGLTIDTAPEWVYGADTVVYMDSAPGSIGITPITTAVHSATFRVNSNLDRKRFADILPHECDGCAQA